MERLKEDAQLVADVLKKRKTSPEGTVRYKEELGYFKRTGSAKDAVEEAGAAGGSAEPENRPPAPREEAPPVPAMDEGNI